MTFWLFCFALHFRVLPFTIQSRTNRPRNIIMTLQSWIVASEKAWRLTVEDWIGLSGCKAFFFFLVCSKDKKNVEYGEGSLFQTIGHGQSLTFILEFLFLFRHDFATGKGTVLGSHDDAVRAVAYSTANSMCFQNKTSLSQVIGNPFVSLYHQI